MIKNEINSSIAVLDKKKKQLVSYLEEQMGSIVFPEAVNAESPNNINQTKNRTSNLLPKCLLIGGLVLLIIGLCIKNPDKRNQPNKKDQIETQIEVANQDNDSSTSTVVSILGILAMVGGGFLLFKERQHSTNLSKDKGIIDIDFSRLTNSIYDALGSAQSHIKKEWDSFLWNQNNLLKSKIQSVDIDYDQKVQMLDKLSQRSLVKFSMMDAYSELISASKMKDISLLKNTMNELTNKLAGAIEIAYREQCDVYNSLV